MAGASVTVKVDDQEVRRALKDLEGRAEDLQPAFEQIGAALLASTQQRFEEERSPEGEPWAELAPSTQHSFVTRRRRAKGAPRRRGGRRRGGDHILRNRGHLYSSLTYLASKDNVQVGTNRVYGAIHQLGGTDEMEPGPAAIPARPFLGVSEADQKEITTIVAEHFE